MLVVSLALRWAIAVRGGQYYWSDESRYSRAQAALGEFLKGQWSQGLQELFRGADHVLFRVLALIPAGAERAFWGGAAPTWFGACFFGLFSAGILLLVWCIVRKTEREETAAAWACFFSAGCVTGLYYSRHYFPYDASLFVFLLSFWIGLGKTRPLRSWTSGLLAGIGYLVYNGYWSVGAALLVAHCLFRAENVRGFLIRGVAAGVGLVTPVFAVIALARAGGVDYLADTVQFSRTVTQGDFGQGLRFVVDFTRESEGTYAAVLLVLVLVSLVGRRRTRSCSRGASVLWVGVGLLLLGLTVFFSDVLPRFVVYARTAKPLYLFLAMAAGAAITRAPGFQHRWFRWGMAAACLFVICANFAQPLRQQFPLDFRVQAQRRVEVEAKRDPGVALGLLNASVFHRPVFAREIPKYEALLEAKHPLQFRPYVYDGYTQAMRDEFAAHDFTMRLVRFTEAQTWKDSSPGLEKALQNDVGLVRLRLTLPNPIPAGTSEPLLVTGIPEHGDLLCIEYLGADRARLFVDHWNVGLVRSEPFEIGPGQHQALICMGSLLPPDATPLMTSFDELKRLRDRVIVEWDGKVVANLRTGLYPAGHETIRVGKNLIGGTTAGTSFTGTVETPMRVDPRAILSTQPWLEATGAAPNLTQIEHEGAIQFSFAAEGLSESTPLLSMRDGERTLAVSAIRAPDGVVCAVSINGRVVGRSERCALEAGRHSAVLLFPWLSSAKAGAGQLEQALERRACVLRIDDHVVWRADLAQLGVAERSRAPVRAVAPVVAFGSTWPIDGGTEKARGLSVADVGRFAVNTRLLNLLSSTRSEVGEARPRSISLRFSLPLEAIGQQPLAWFGETGAGDLIFVQFEAARFRIGHDHWGARPQFTAWLARTAAPVGLQIDFHPSAASNELLRGTVAVLVNERVAAALEVGMYAFTRDNWVVGWNLAGASTASTLFSGEIQEVRTDE